MEEPLHHPTEVFVGPDPRTAQQAVLMGQDQTGQPLPGEQDASDQDAAIWAWSC